MTLAGGAIGLSVTCMEKIDPNPSISELWLLGASWLAFLLTILTSLLSHFTSRLAICDVRNELDESFAKPEESTDVRTKKWTQWTQRFNLGCLISFGIGVILFCLFGFLEISRKDVTNVGKKESCWQAHKVTSRNCASIAPTTASDCATSEKTQITSGESANMKKNQQSSFVVSKKIRQLWE